jgi:hypothetical protein
MFTEEMRRKEPRSPEATRILIEDLRLGPVFPVFISPKRSYAQVCSDVGITHCNWMQRRASVFYKRQQALQEVTPSLTVKKGPPRIPIEEWTTRGNDCNMGPPPVAFARRRL